VAARSPRATPLRAAAMRGFLVVVIVVSSALAVIMPVSAHNRVLSTTPGSGVLLYESPPTVDIVVNADVAERSASLTLADPSGQVVRLGPVVVDKARISASVPRLTIPGAYQVTYRVTTLDGHPVSASYFFTLSTSRAPTLVDWVVGILQGAIPAAAVIFAGVVFWRWRNRRRSSPPPSHVL